MVNFEEALLKFPGNLVVKEKKDEIEKKEEKEQKEQKVVKEKKEKVESKTEKPSPSTKERQKEKKNQKLRESPAGWNSQDAGLAASKWVRIKDIKPSEPYPFPREGPHNVSLVPLPRSPLNISKCSVSNNV